MQCTPRKVFNSLLQSNVYAKQARDENSLSGVVAETMKFVGKISYQTMDTSKHTITKYPGDKIKHQVINNQFFKTLNVVAKDLYEVEFVKTTIEHREPNNVRFVILRYAKLRMFELYQFATSTNLKKSKWIQILLIWFWQKFFFIKVSFPASEQNGTKSEARNVETIFIETRILILPRICCFSRPKKCVKREPGLFEKELRCTKLLCL